MSGTEEQKKKHKRRIPANIIQWVVLTVILFTYLVIVLVNYSVEVRSNVSENVDEALLNYTKQTADKFMGEINHAEHVADALAELFAMQAGKTAVQNSDNMEILENMLDGCNALDGYISDIKGNAIYCSGIKKNVSEYSSFARAITGASKLSEIFVDEDSGQYVVAVSVPIMGEGILYGVVSMNIPVERFENIPRTGAYDGRTKYLLTMRDGTIVSLVSTPAAKKGDSVFDLISDTKGDDEPTTTQLARAMQNGKSGFVWCMESGVRRKLVYKSLAGGEWYVMELYTEDYVNGLVNRDYRKTRDIVIHVLCAMALFFGLIVLINVINRAVYAKQNKELQNKAETDLLTGLLNKIATQKHIEEYLEGEGKNKNAMLCVLDIDNFKKINDTLGHAFGDQVLSELGAGIRSEFRITDIVGRIGGDEFLVFLKDIKTDEIRVKEAARVAGFFKDFKAGDYVKYSATASIGVAMYPKNGKTFEELYKAADRGVYLAKQRGKNRLCFCDEKVD